MAADYSNLVQDLLAELKRRGAPITLDDLAQAIGLSRFDKRALRDQLDRLVKSGEAIRIGNKRYRFHQQKAEKTERPGRETGKEKGKGQSSPFEDAGSPRRTRLAKKGAQRGGPPGGGRHAPERPGAPRKEVPSGNAILGVYAQTRTGVGYVTPWPPRKDVLDIVIPEGLQGGALHGDRVRVDVRVGGSGRPVGRVVRIEERGRRYIAGTLVEKRGALFCEPLDDRLPVVQLGELDAKFRKDIGSIALVSFEASPDEPNAMLQGRIRRVLGDLEDPQVQFEWIVAEFRLPEEFPPAVNAEAAAYGEKVRPSDLEGRTDLRKLPIVTIDGEDAKDFDDAVYVEKTPQGYRLIVSIADVSHYVRPGTALDAEAVERGTSIYFPGRVIPMLPEGLSNELCSLKPDVDRLTLTCEIEFDHQGRQVSKKLYESVIHNHARMTYTRLQQVLDGTSTEVLERYRDHVDRFRLMEELARKLLAERMRKGAIDLELPELHFALDGEGRCVGMSLKPRLFAHRIVEEFMLAANRAVAEVFTDAELPFVYRIHESPDPLKVDAVNEILAPFGVAIEYRDVVRPKDVQHAVESLRGKPVERAASMLILRSLKQARYDPKNEGHFGLAFEDYTHFTSPIRRYPDLEVHRLVRLFLRHDLAAIRARGGKLAEICAKSSELERRAMTAERAYHDIKTAEFMQTHLFAEFEGTITSIARHGFYVAIDGFGAEGLVPLEGIDSDRYSLTDDGGALAGSKTGKTFAAGDRVRVQAVDASLSRRRILFRWMKTLKRVSGAPMRKTDRGGKPRGSKEGSVRTKHR